MAGEGKYPDIVSGKDLNRISEKEDKEESTERMPDIEVESEVEINSDMEMSEGASDDDADTVDNISDLEMENFELSDERADMSEDQETTIEPSEDDLEITTTIY